MRLDRSAMPNNTHCEIICVVRPPGNAMHRGTKRWDRQQRWNDNARNGPRGRWDRQRGWAVGPPTKMGQQCSHSAVGAVGPPTKMGHWCPHSAARAVGPPPKLEQMCSQSALKAAAPPRLLRHAHAATNDGTASGLSSDVASVHALETSYHWTRPTKCSEAWR